MEKFINTNHNITDIVLAIWVAPGMVDTVHKNRHSHGLALNCAGEKIYTFNDGRKYVVKENDFIYLTDKGMLVSNYIISELLY